MTGWRAWRSARSLAHTPLLCAQDAAGKTTILYKLHIGEVLSTVPTIGEGSGCSVWGWQRVGLQLALRWRRRQLPGIVVHAKAHKSPAPTL